MSVAINLFLYDGAKCKPSYNYHFILKMHLGPCQPSGDPLRVVDGVYPIFLCNEWQLSVNSHRKR